MISSHTIETRKSSQLSEKRKAFREAVKRLERYFSLAQSGLNAEVKGLKSNMTLFKSNRSTSDLAAVCVLSLCPTLQDSIQHRDLAFLHLGICLGKRRSSC